MLETNNLTNTRVFYYFEEISKIPHGSGNMKGIADFCENFAKEQGLRYFRDEMDNIVIFKDGTNGYENSTPVIMQGHLDMVCQKTADSKIDFSKDPLELYIDGDFIKAKNTTLGADDGIGVALILAVLESKDFSHPPIEAVFTVDEEIGMLGASKLDMSKLSGKKLINIDSFNDACACVSCAGGADIKMHINLKRVIACGKKLKLSIDGLLGGHSGGKIKEGRVNANILAGRILACAKKISDFDIISINGGDKGNAITPRCAIELVVKDTEGFISKLEEVFENIKNELSDREENLNLTVSIVEEGNFQAIDKESRDKLINMLLSIPDGVLAMSKKISGLVETSSNLGIAATHDDKILLHSTIRSNKRSALEWLQERMFMIAEYNNCNVEASGHYPPWELVENSEMQKIFADTCLEIYEKEANIYATHAGLECGIFAGKIEGLDGIAIGPSAYDVHTVFERLSISAVNKFYDFLKVILAKLK